MSDDVEWTPAFPGQRPPFQPGNKLAVTHGTYSPARVDPLAHEYIAEVIADPATAYLGQARFSAALWSWATAQAKVQLLTTWVDGMDISVSGSAKAGQTSPLELLRKWMATAQTWASRLGLDPLSAARLGKDVAQGQQASAATILTELRTQAEAGRTPPPPQDG
ncbi:hypothetical protein [Subtercola vilae]|uniref:Uncharacterized protein n=1 Tax=Subtercola vilae TaxID=2056433 RepID=A0A4T2BR39_9MICO|nr:hypothetical protein [Subtercola vilae]TIH33690.1 hypothetical protein D4765_14505 [Subtercola vilae]